MLRRVVYYCKQNRLYCDTSKNYDLKSKSPVHYVGFHNTLCCCSSYFCLLVSDTDYLSFRKYNDVMLIIIKRPEKRNALNEPTLEALKHAIEYFERDTNFKAGVIAGEGGNFCAGYDLEELAGRKDVPEHFRHNVSCS